MKKVRGRYLLLLGLALAGFFASRSGGTPPQAAVTMGLSAASSPEAKAPAKAGPPPFPPVLSQEGRVRPGETLLGLLRGAGVADEAIIVLARQRPEGIDLARLRPGRPFRILTRGGKAVEYQYEPDEARLVRADLSVQPPVVAVFPIPYTRCPITVRGEITESLFGAVEAAGEDAALALDLAEVFAWQVDFFRDLRKGDSFTVLVEKVYRDGRFVRYGDILAAEFVNAGKRYSAFLFNGAEGKAEFYDEEGGSLRKEFLKAPLRFRRISSSYALRRLHPVTGRMRAHQGTDYAAPVGTPVRSIGDGRVVQKKADAANGRFLKIRHNGTYSSAYAHLNSFASGVGVGSVVRQGEIIGHVGSSGLSTGSHLHFILYRNGAAVDPRTVEVPRARSLAPEEREAFARLVGERRALLADASAQVAREVMR